MTIPAVSREKRDRGCAVSLPEGRLPLDPRGDFVEAASHEEFEVVEPLKAGLVDEVPYSFRGWGFEDPEHLVPRVEV